MAESFKLSPNKAANANLGCGTLILIGIIVMIFSSPGVQGVKTELFDLSAQVRELSTAVDNQAAEIKKLREALERERSVPATPSEEKKAAKPAGPEGATGKP